MLTWCTMPVPGGTTLNSSNARLAPAQELVALAVALVLEFDVAGERVGGAEQVGDHRVVDHQLGRRQRVDLLRVAAEFDDRLAHGGQVDDAGTPVKSCMTTRAGRELDLGVGLGRGIPAGERLDLIGGDVGAVLGPQQVLEQHLEAVGELLGIGDGVETVDLVTVVADLQGVAGSERVHRIFTHINSLGFSSPPTGRVDGACRV